MHHICIIAPGQGYPYMNLVKLPRSGLVQQQLTPILTPKTALTGDFHPSN